MNDSARGHTLPYDRHAQPFAGATSQTTPQGDTTFRHRDRWTRRAAFGLGLIVAAQLTVLAWQEGAAWMTSLGDAGGRLVTSAGGWPLFVLFALVLGSLLADVVAMARLHRRVRRHGSAPSPVERAQLKGAMAQTLGLLGTLLALDSIVPGFADSLPVSTDYAHMMVRTSMIGQGASFFLQAAMAFFPGSIEEPST